MRPSLQKSLKTAASPLHTIHKAECLEKSTYRNSTTKITSPNTYSVASPTAKLLGSLLSLYPINSIKSVKDDSNEKTINPPKTWCKYGHTLWRLGSEVDVIQRTDLVGVHVTPGTTFDAAYVPHFNAKRLIVYRIVALRVSANTGRYTRMCRKSTEKRLKRSNICWHKTDILCGQWPSIWPLIF